MPKYGMDRIKSACNNLEYPKRCVSCLLQRDFKSSGKETVRFLTNSTLGLGGLYDPAKKFFKIEQKQEDMEQVLASYKLRKGPYIVLPIIPPSNTRGVVGKILDCPLDPALYVIGPVTLIVKAGMTVNKSADMLSLMKSIENTYADPYDITKKLYGMDNFIKNSNLDRKEVLAQIVNSQNPSLPPESSSIPDVEKRFVTAPPKELKPDITLSDYNPQGPVADSMRTALFEVPDLDNSIWSEMSIWNRSFSKRIKSGAVSIAENKPKCKYRYILQKDKKAPLAIIYPSIGEGVMSHHSVVLAKIFYDEGYSVLIQSSNFQWEFVKSMPQGYKPGLPAQDAEYLRIVTGKIVDSLKSRYGCDFNGKIMVGTSFGAFTGLFVAAKEEVDNTLGISKFISINPPIEAFYALSQLDRNCEEWNKDPNNIKMRAAVTAGKILQVTKSFADENEREKIEALPFSEDEAKLIVGFVMRQKLSDVIFAIENVSTARKTDIYNTINNMSYQDYVAKYIIADKIKEVNQLSYDTSLYSISDFIKNSDKYKIYHTLDDYFVSPRQLAWLRKLSSNRTVLLNNGSHLGFLYRKEFQDSLKNDIKLDNKLAKKD